MISLHMLKNGDIFMYNNILYIKIGNLEAIDKEKNIKTFERSVTVNKIEA